MAHLFLFSPYHYQLLIYSICNELETEINLNIPNNSNRTVLMFQSEAVKKI